jgi:hypothetical protein
MYQLKVRLSLFLALYGIDWFYSLIGAPYPLAYFLAGLAGAVTVWLLPLLGTHKLIKDIQIIQTFWVAVHALGFVMYMFGFDPDFYDNIQIFLNLTQILWLVWARHDDTNYSLCDDGLGRVRNSHTNLR